MRCGWPGDSCSRTKRSLQDSIRSALFAGIVVFSVWSFVLMLHWVMLKGREAAPPDGLDDGCFYPWPEYEIAPSTEHASIPGVENDPEIDSHQLLELTSLEVGESGSFCTYGIGCSANRPADGQASRSGSERPNPGPVGPEPSIPEAHPTGTSQCR